MLFYEIVDSKWLENQKDLQQMVIFDRSHRPYSFLLVFHCNTVTFPSLRLASICDHKWPREVLPFSNSSSKSSSSCDRCATRWSVIPSLFFLPLRNVMLLIAAYWSTLAYAVIVSRILYALPSWGGFLSTYLANRMDIFFGNLDSLAILIGLSLYAVCYKTLIYTVVY